MKTLIILLLFISTLSFANTYNDGVKAYNLKQYKEAYDIWLDLAKDNDKLAQYAIGILYENGHGVKQSVKEAFTWYEMSAESGNTKVQYGLGNAYYFGNGVSKNHDRAIYWWNMASKQGVTNAQYNLGVIYLLGDKKYRDIDKAKELLEKAAKKNHKPAQKILAKYKDFLNKNKELTQNTTSEQQILPEVIKPKKTVKPTKKKAIKTKQPSKAKKSKAKKGNWISRQPKNNYSIQLVVLKSKKEVLKYLKTIKKYRLRSKAYYYKSGSQYKIIYGSYPGYSIAKKKINNLPRALKRNKPWPKNFKKIRAERGY